MEIFTRLLILAYLSIKFDHNQIVPDSLYIRHASGNQYVLTKGVKKNSVKNGGSDPGSICYFISRPWISVPVSLLAGFESTMVELVKKINDTVSPFRCFRVACRVFTVEDNRLRIRLLAGGSSWTALGFPRKERGRDSLYVETIRRTRLRKTLLTLIVDRNTCRPHNMGVHDNLTTLGFY